jgi:hypothetical protein
VFGSERLTGTMMPVSSASSPDVTAGSMALSRLFGPVSL